MRPLLASVLVLAITSSTIAQRCWGQVVSAPVGAKVVVPVTYEWRPVADDPDELALFRNGKQIGNWSKSKHYYRPMTAKGFGSPTALPHPLPTPVVTQGPKLPEVENFGVDLSKLAGPGYRICERNATRAEAFQAIEQGLPDDSFKLRLTIIGSDADRLRVEKDWHTSDKVKDLWSRALVWSVPPDHWSVKGNGFEVGGRPTIYLTDARGKVLHRQNDYAGPEDFGAIRKAVAEYDKTKDPDLRRSTPGGIPMGWLLAGGALVFYLATRERK